MADPIGRLIAMEEQGSRAERVVAAILGDLRDRSGIGDAIEQVDDDIFDEIIATLVEKASAILAPSS
jgi:hypothetical protein